jgi:hypothetical protein
MKFRRNPPGWLCSLAILLFLVFAGVAAPAKDLKFDAVLVWATNAEKSPDPGHKPVDEDVRRKLSELPLKWANYFEVNRKGLTVARGGADEVALSDKCKIEVKDIDGKTFEISLIGKGESVLKRIQPLPRKEMLVLGGNAPNSTGWLVVLKRTD